MLADALREISLQQLRRCKVVGVDYTTPTFISPPSRRFLLGEAVEIILAINFSRHILSFPLWWIGYSNPYNNS